MSHRSAQEWAAELNDDVRAPEAGARHGAQLFVPVASGREKGETEGRKDRPATVVLVTRRTGFGDIIYLLPITTSVAQEFLAGETFHSQIIVQRGVDEVHLLADQMMRIRLKGPKDHSIHTRAL